VRNLGYAALAAVILQGVLGGLRVTMLKDEIGIFHACLAQSLSGLMIVIALVTSPFWARLSSARVLAQNARLLARISITTSLIIYGATSAGRRDAARASRSFDSRFSIRLRKDIPE